MKKITTLLIIGLLMFSMVLVGCDKQEDVYGFDERTEPPTGGGCGVANPTIQEPIDLNSGEILKEA